MEQLLGTQEYYIDPKINEIPYQEVRFLIYLCLRITDLVC
jgi:hypothetical protein